MGQLFQSPCPAKIDHAKSVANRLGHPLARELVWCCQEHHVDAGFFHSLPGETLQRKAALARDLRVDFAQIGYADALAGPLEEKWLSCATMMGEQTHQLEAGVAGRTKHRWLYSRDHLCEISSNAVRQPFRNLVAGRDDQDRVVASDGPHNLVPLFGVNGRRHWLRAASAGFHHHQRSEEHTSELQSLR